MKTLSVLFIFGALCGASTFGGEQKPKSYVEKMDFGQALTYSVRRIFPKEQGAKGPPKEELIAVKGFNIRVGKDRETTLCFDTDSLRWVGAWDGFLDFSNTNCGRDKGTGPAVVTGEWKSLEPRDFPTFRKAGEGARKRWKGHFVHGSHVILSYEIDGVSYLESPSLVQTDLKPYCNGGPARWPEVLKTKGTIGQNDAAYVIDTLTLPEKNPWNSWMRPSGLDFFPDGRLAFCTLSGDVWILSGIDEKLEELSWKRYAAGFYEPLGLKIVDNKIYVLGRDQITRLHDLNGDNEADFYECFHALESITPSYHAFVFDLQTDSAGNFYFSSCGNQIELNLLPKHGCITKVSKDGTKSEVICSGLRAPNGLCIGPRDEITCSDNQGYWVCTSKINWIKPGGFYGHVADPRKDPQKTVAPPASFDPPLVWIPVSADNSSGGQVWVTSDKWGPYKDHLIHFSYGKCDMFAVLHENCGGVMQGGVVKFPLHFASGTMRARFHPKDGQLYVAGMKGWQTAGARDGCIQRVRYTGAPLYMPVEMHATERGIDITFATSIDPASAADIQNFGVEQSNYEWTREYNAKELSVADPTKKGRDTVTISAAKLSTDGKTVSLAIPDIKPVMQMRIKMNLKAADGNPISCEVFNTINKLK